MISNCSYYTENKSSFLDYHLQPLAQNVKSYIKDTNHFLSKLKSLGKLPKEAILCTVGVGGLYPNIPHSEGLTSLPRFLELRGKKQISSDTLLELAEILLNSMKKLLTMYAEPQLEQSFHLHMLFCVWLTSRKKFLIPLRRNLLF